jgi:hypothetical protein
MIAWANVFATLLLPNAVPLSVQSIARATSTSIDYMM